MDEFLILDYLYPVFLFLFFLILDMSFIRDIQTRLFTVYRKFKKFPNKPHNPVSLEQAKKIGILFNAEDVKDNDSILAFSEKLKSSNKDVQLLGFIDHREFGNPYPFPFFTAKDLSWFGKPAGGTCGYFMHFPFDLLITFSKSENQPLDYISASSSAKLRVGFFSADNTSDYDIVFLPSQNKISHCINSIETYLK